MVGCNYKGLNIVEWSGYIHVFIVSRWAGFSRSWLTETALLLTRLNFGMNFASDIFQKVMNDLLCDIPGVRDDVIVFGKTHERAWRRIQGYVSEVRKCQSELKQKMCEFNKKGSRFVFSGRGISPDPKRVDAIKNAKPPSTSSGVWSFLGMATYCAKFIPNSSDISEPLRELTKKDAQFQLSEQHERSFNRINWKRYLLALI